MWLWGSSPSDRSRSSTSTASDLVACSTATFAPARCPLMEFLSAEAETSPEAASTAPLTAPLVCPDACSAAAAVLLLSLTSAAGLRPSFALPLAAPLPVL